MKQRKSAQQRANLRVCASCEWIYPQASAHPDTGGCPRCGFASYGARFVYGNKAYRFAQTQQPWFNRELAAYASQLRQQIKQHTPPPVGTVRSGLDHLITFTKEVTHEGNY